MRTIEQYKSANAEREARRNAYEQKQQQTSNQGKRFALWWFRSPDRIVKYTGWLSAYTFLLAAITALLFAATIYTAHILHETDVKIGEQIDALKAQFYITRRPWIALVDIVSAAPLTFKPDGASVEIALYFKNGGISVARGINLTIGDLRIQSIPIPPQSLPFQVFAATLKNIAGDSCSSARVKMMATVAGELLLPGEQYKRPVHLATKQNAFHFNEDTKTVSAWVPVCIGYIDEFGVPHGTSFVIQYLTSNSQNRFIPDNAIDGQFGVFGGSVNAY